MNPATIKITTDSPIATPPLPFRPKSRGLIPRGLTLMAVLLILVILAVIIGNIVMGGAGTISWEFLTHPPEQGMEAGGIFPAIFGTVALVLLMVIAVIPVGVFAAIYLHEYTSPQSWLARLIRVAINNLAAIRPFDMFSLLLRLRLESLE